MPLPEDNFSLCEVESVGHNEETELEEYHPHHNADGVVLQLLNHRSGPSRGHWSRTLEVGFVSLDSNKSVYM